MKKRITAIFVIFALITTTLFLCGGTESTNSTLVSKLPAHTKNAYKCIFVNGAGADTPYIYRNTSSVGQGWRVCCKDTELVYKFDLNEFPEGVFFVRVMQNYILSVSADDTNYTVVANYDEISNGVHINGFANSTAYCIDSKEYNCQDKIYIRLTNTDVTNAAGGAINNIIIRYQVEDDSVVLFGDLNYDNTISASDALIALQKAVDRIDLDENAMVVADMNIDDKVNSSDALTILQIAVKKITHCKAELKQNAIIHDGDTVLFTGDSVTDAGRIYESPDSLGTGYVASIVKQMKVKFGDKSIVYKNRGKNGSCTSHWIEWIKNYLDETKPDVVSIMIGINDTWRRYDQNTYTSAQAYADNLRIILAQAAETGAKLIVISPFALPDGTNDTDLWHEEDLNEKIERCQEITKEFDAVYIPMDDIFINKYLVGDIKGTAYSADGVHPNSTGAAIIAAEWINAVSEAGIYF